MAQTVAKRPLITANMVTFTRMIPIPLVCWLIYRNHLWTALVVGTLIGCTDFIDGALARKYGPTVLGGLMDPIADKVFIAFVYLPVADLGVVPAWAVAAMFVRELMVTALRSSYEQRSLQMKTSYLGKVKTWTQMQGIGMMFLFILLAAHQSVLLGLLLAATVAPLVAIAIFWAVKKRLWTGALVMSAASAPLLGLHFHGDLALTVELIMYAVVAITWISGLDYVVVGLRQLRGRGDFGRADAARLLGAIAMPCLLFAAVAGHAASPWPLAFILALELAVGGLDNLQSHHRVAAGALAWGARVFGTSLLLSAALLLERGGHDSYVNWAGGAALAVCVLGTAVEFWRGSDVYLDRKLREESSSSLPAVDPGTV